MTTESIIKHIKAACEEIFANNLTGVYLHGSLAFGCYNTEKVTLTLSL